MKINENIRGEGKGGGSTPVEGADTLRARQTAKSLVAVCEGPIDNIEKIYFNDTDVDNYADCGYYTRNGESTQTSIPLFSDTSSTVDVGIELVGPGGVIYGYITTASTTTINLLNPVTIPTGKNTISIKLSNGKTETKTILNTGTTSTLSVTAFSVAPTENSACTIKLATSQVYPVIQDVSSSDIDEIIVNLQLDALVKIDDKGNAGGYSVSFLVETRISSSDPWITFNTWVIKGKTTKPYVEALSIPRPDGASNKVWGVRITRNTKPDPNTKTQSTSRWVNSNQIIHKSLTYDNTALVGIFADAKSTGGSIPRVSMDVKGLKIKVPHNYNPTTRVYFGAFNGTLSTAVYWTDNPAYCLLDLLTNTRYGMGIPLSKIDIYSFYNAGTYCDQTVTYTDESGNTKNTTRFTYNNIIQTYEDAFTLIQAVASCMRGFVVDLGGLLTLIQDRPTNANQVFTNANVIDGIFEYNSNELQERYTTVNVTYNEPSDRYLQKVLSVPNSNDHTYDTEIAKYPYNSVDIAAVGVTDAGQAYRLGKYYLDNSLMTGENVQFKTSIQHAFVQPGDVILVADSHYSGENVGGRIISATSNSVTLDRSITLSGGTNSISLYLPDGTIETDTISQTNGTYTTLHVTGSFAQIPNANSPYIITLSTSSRPPRKFRVSKVTLMSSEESNLLEISGSLYDASKYTRVDNTFSLPIAQFSDPVQYGVPKPFNVTKKIIQTFDSVNNVSKNDLFIDWDPGDTSSYTYIVKYSFESGDFLEFEVMTDNFTIKDAEIGYYEVWIYAKNIHGALSEGVLVDITYQESTNEYSPLPLVDQNTVLNPMTNFYVKGTTAAIFSDVDLYLTWTDSNILSGANQSIVSRYIIEVYNSTYDTLLNTYHVNTSSTEFTYSYVMNRNDYGIPSRNVYMKLYAEDANQRRSTAVTKTFNNPVPELKNWTVSPSIGLVYVSINESTDTDINEYLIYRDTTPDFTKDDTTLVYAGKERFINIKAPNGILYYYAYSISDSFGRDNLNVSLETSATSVSADQPDQYNYENLTFVPNHNAPQNVSGGVDSGYSLNAIYWTQFKTYKNGVLLDTVSSGTYTFNPGSGSTMFLYYIPNNTTLQNSYSIHDAITAGGRILATYKGGSDLSFDEGKAFISGDQLLAGTVGANALVTNTAVITNMAQIDNVIQSSNYVNDITDPLNPIHTGWRIDKTGHIDAASISIYDNNQLIFGAGNYTGKLNNTNTSTVVNNANLGANKNQVYSQDNAPTGTVPVPLVVGDLWIDTNDSNKLYRYDGVVWQTVRDAGISQALTNASNAQATADGKIDSFFQTTAPVSGMALGDIWFDTDDSNKLYRYNGTSWQLARDDGITTAISAASTAQSTANSKVVTYFQTTAPQSTTIGDLWYNSNDSLLKRWNGSTWVIVSNAYTNSNQLTDGAGWSTTATWANITGTGKPADNATSNTIYRQTTTPTGGIYTTGDLWVDTDAVPTTIAQWNGSTWSIVSSYTNNTNQLTDGAGLGTTATWSGVTGTGKPSDNATKNVVTYSSVAPTATDGDIWVDTSSNPYVAKVRVSGVWQIASNYTTNSNQLTDGAGWSTTATWANITGTGKPSDGATKNVIYRQTTAPTGGTYTTGDLWVDTDSVPTTISQWNGASWGIVSSYTNNTNQLTDGAGLGTTSTWNGVSGTGKPADNATKNVVTYSAVAPTATDGDIWVDTSSSPYVAKVRVSGLWYAASNYTTNTNQLTDGANLGGTALWSGVTGTGKPVDGATKNVIYNQITAPTGGTYTTGDLWVDTDANPTTVAQWNGSIWNIVGNYTNNTNQLTDGAGLGTTSTWNGVTGTGKPADNATKNVVTYSSVAPTATDGDIWVDTSATPYTAKVRVSGAWQTASNYTTNTNQLTDGAGLGTTATWNGVSGTGKPADNATVNNLSQGLLASRPTGVNGDFYYATDTYTLYQKIAGSWISSSTLGAPTGTLVGGTDAGTVASNAATGATKNKTFVQTTAPASGMIEGDIWINTTLGNKLYRYTSSVWTAYQDTAITTAQSTADGKNKTFYSSATPTGMIAGDLWYDTTNKILKRYNGTTWDNTVINASNTSGAGTPTGGQSGDSYFDTTTNLMWFNNLGTWKKVMPQITSSNATTFIASAAIGQTQIGNAAIGTAQIIDANITTLKVATDQIVPMRYNTGGYTSLTFPNTQTVTYAIQIPATMTGSYHGDILVNWCYDMSPAASDYYTYATIQFKYASSGTWSNVTNLRGSATTFTTRVIAGSANSQMVSGSTVIEHGFLSTSTEAVDIQLTYTHNASTSKTTNYYSISATEAKR